MTKVAAKTDLIYFSLAPSIYAAHSENAVIILDSDSNKYISLIESAAKYLDLICRLEFIYAEGAYQTIDSLENIDTKELNDWIEEFKCKGFIYESTQTTRKYVAPSALKSGGLHEYQWDKKAGWRPFAATSKLAILRAFFLLSKVHFQMKKQGIKGLLHSIKKNAKRPNRSPSAEEIDRLAATVDAASLLYPKKTYCLAWAATFTILALKKGWDCRFFIGVQTTPFYAHAWAEIEGAVINDDPVITKALSIILQEP